MTKPCSMDLRKRSVALVNLGQSASSVARRLCVSPSSVIKWMQLYRRTGSVAPGKVGGHRPAKIAGDQRIWLLERIGSSDFTLRGLVIELAERGLAVDYKTVWTFVHAADLSFKKNRSRRRAAKTGRRTPPPLVEEVSAEA